MMTVQEKADWDQRLAGSYNRVQLVMHELRNMRVSYQNSSDAERRVYGDLLRVYADKVHNWKDGEYINIISTFRNTAAISAKPFPLPVFDTDDLATLMRDVCAYLGIDLKKSFPIPTDVKLKRDKQVVVTKTVEAGYINDRMGILRALYDTLQELKKEYPKGEPQNDEETEETYQSKRQRVRNWRRALREQYSHVTNYTLERGGITVSGSMSEGEMRHVPLFRDLLAQIRSHIGHARQACQVLRPKERLWRTKLAVRDYQLIGGTFLTPGRILGMAERKKIDRVYEDKKPKTRGIHVGVEIEFVCKLPKADIASLLYRADLADYVTLVEDNSLRTSSEEDYAHEVCILAPETEMAHVLERACTVLRDAGGYVNRSCGLHVHLDMRSRVAPAAFTRLIKGLGVLYQVVPYERVFNKHCKRNPTDMPFEPKEFKKGTITEERYWAINPHSFTRHKTIEVRMHSGTISPVKIWRWIQLLTLIVDVPVKKVPEQLEDFIAAYKIVSPLDTYLRERAAKFDRARQEFDDETKLALITDRDSRIEGHMRSSKCRCAECTEGLRRQNRMAIMAQAEDTKKKRKAA